MECFKSSRLRCLVSSIERHFKKNHYPVSIINDNLNYIFTFSDCYWILVCATLIFQGVGLAVWIYIVHMRRQSCDNHICFRSKGSQISLGMGLHLCALGLQKVCYKYVSCILKCLWAFEEVWGLHDARLWTFNNLNRLLLSWLLPVS